ERFIKKEIKQLESGLEKYRKEIKGIENDIKPIKDKIKKSKELSELSDSLQEYNDTKNQILEVEKDLKLLERKYKKKINEIIKCYILFEKRYKKISSVDIGDFEFSNIKLSPTFDSDSLRNFIKEYINRQKINSEIENWRDQYKEENKNLLLDLDENWIYSVAKLKSLLKFLLNGIISNSIILKQNNEEKKEILTGLFSNKYKLDFAKCITGPKKGDVDFSKMSDGQKMLALLEFIFELDDYNYPILLDQPEDDIDARAIANDIVKFLKKNKGKRQILMASHNANLVVLSDSEEVIVSEKSGRSSELNFEYKTGAIEDESIRNDIIKILEGGREAMIKRKEKLEIDSN
ncbi:MAG: hypothetical protein WD607_10410, partial [Candidatus Paceibacterota bacterium]